MSLVFADNQIMVHAIDETGNKMKNGKKKVNIDHIGKGSYLSYLRVHF